MFGCRTAIGVGCYALLLSLGCGGAVARGEPEGGPGGTSSQAGAPPLGRAGSAVGGSSSFAGTPALGGNAGVAAQGGSAGTTEPDPIDGGCPPQEPPPPDLECDPFDVASCGPGASCYPFVDHPEGSGCEPQRYGSTCLPAGQGTQGALCGTGESDRCAPGHVCVVGQQAGKRCAALCRLGQPNPCSGGLLCGSLDVAGFGVCG